MALTNFKPLIMNYEEFHLKIASQKLINWIKAYWTILIMDLDWNSLNFRKEINIEIDLVFNLARMKFIYLFLLNEACFIIIILILYSC